jgi:hypothetical protein
MKSTKQSLVLLAASSLLSIALAPRADAQILAASGTPTVTTVTGGYNWAYDAILGSTSQVRTGDFFTIYDFGTGSLVSAPVGWILTTASLAPTPINGALVPTQTSALNFTFTYSGANVGSGSQVDLGQFVLFSTHGTGQTAAWASVTHDANGALQGNLTNTEVPFETVSVTPEPASLTLMATGLVGIGGVGLRRRKRA